MENRREIRCVRTNSESVDFRNLVALLDQDLSARNGDEDAFFAQFNKIDLLQHVVVLFVNDSPVSCGAIKLLSPDTMEVKRMYTHENHRGHRFAEIVLRELESWAAEIGFSFCQLETGLKQPEAIQLYRRNGYIQIPNYGQYEGVGSSVCFRKSIK